MRVVYGVNPVRELLRAGAEGLAELWLAEGAVRGALFGDLERQARACGAKVRRAPRQKLDRLAGTDRHQGAVAVVADFRYAELEPMVASAREGGGVPLLVVLDGVEDPQHLGAVARSALALGAHGVVIPRDRAAGVTPAAVKASAGAVERLPIARVTNLARALASLKEAGLWAVALAAGGDRPLGEVDLTAPTALVLGSEGQGLRPLVLRSCDRTARIPMSGGFESLSVSAAAAVALYEAARQRGTGRGQPPADPQA
jgi:23S rRNA (guanosine2251-2'-O)-methyltransferase